jgi:hypothetical protein
MFSFRNYRNLPTPQMCFTMPLHYERVVVWSYAMPSFSFGRGCSASAATGTCQPSNVLHNASPLRKGSGVILCYAKLRKSMFSFRSHRNLPTPQMYFTSQTGVCNWSGAVLSGSGAEAQAEDWGQVWNQGFRSGGSTWEHLGARRVIHILIFMYFNEGLLPIVVL